MKLEISHKIKFNQLQLFLKYRLEITINSILLCQEKKSFYKYYGVNILFSCKEKLADYLRENTILNLLR